MWWMSTISVGAVGGKPGQRQRGATADVQRANPAPVERRRPLHRGGLAADADRRAELQQLVGVLQPPIVDALVDDAGAFGLSQERAERRLKVGREAGIVERLDLDRIHLAVAFDAVVATGRLDA